MAKVESTGKRRESLPTSVSTELAKTEAATLRSRNPVLEVVERLRATPETINPCTKLYYELYLQYTFGTLDLGELILHRNDLTTSVESGKAELERVQEIVKTLRALPARASQYVL